MSRKDLRGGIVMDNLHHLTLFRAKHGDSRAFEQLVTPHEQMIWRVCWRLMGNRHDAEDAMQLTMIKTWKSIGQYRGNAAFSSWMYRIAVHTCTDILRKKKNDRIELVEDFPGDVCLSDTGTMPESSVLETENNERIRQGLNKLDEDQKVTLVLFAVEEKSYTEISEILEIPVGTVKSRIARAREHLRGILEEKGEAGK